MAVEDNSEDRAEWLYSVDGPHAGSDSEDVSIPIPWHDGAKEDVDDTSLRPILTYGSSFLGVRGDSTSMVFRGTMRHECSIRDGLHCFSANGKNE